MKLKATLPPPLLLCLQLAVLSRCFPHASTGSTPPPLSLCAGSGGPPVVLAEALGFCGNSGVSCCDAVDDAALRASFQAMNVSEPESTVLKDSLCARCSLDYSSTPATTTTSSRSAAQQQEASICLERIAADSYLTMAAHPDGSGRIFLSRRDGKIWLASVPKRGSLLRVGDPLLDLADRVHHDAVRGLGLMGVAFHPRFATNGCFFVSYVCEYSTASPGCGSCSAGNCSSPYYQLVVAEFAARVGESHPKEVISADPSEVRKVFTMALPDQTNKSFNQQGGEILFRPRGGGGGDRNLYLIAGPGRDEDSTDDGPTGKIIRLDVDGSTDLQPEAIAVDLMKSPRGCSFDSESPSHLYCANVDQQMHEQVSLINYKAGNYNTSSATAISVVLSHGRLTTGRAPSIVGGLVYWGSADPWLKGRYLYMYGSAVWAADVMTENSTGLYAASTRIPSVKCSSSSSVPCPGGGVHSFGEDNSKDAYFLTTDGLYRLAEPSLCSAAPSPPKTPSGLAWLLSFGASALAIASYMIYMKMFGGGGQSAPNCNGWFSCCATIMCCNYIVANNVPVPAGSNEGRV